MQAVTESINRDCGCWESYYYHGPDMDWSPRRLNVYMECRHSALGPEWGELQYAVVLMKVRQNNRKYGLPKRPS